MNYRIFGWPLQRSRMTPYRLSFLPCSGRRNLTAERSRLHSYRSACLLSASLMACLTFGYVWTYYLLSMHIQHEFIAVFGKGKKESKGFGEFCRNKEK